eukprot:TRINITY_DN7808_c0_g1_i1.p1 TRINITY_DN7808_c0_g1~~TRINITY_DN7808_c0_g1_i1.p1  ORF type:complete len:732 (-),score=187.02 TRINITY_DN7808_c0_g1_i1:36-2231(-)
MILRPPAAEPVAADLFDSSSLDGDSSGSGGLVEATPSHTPSSSGLVSSQLSSASGSLCTEGSVSRAPWVIPPLPALGLTSASGPLGGFRLCSATELQNLQFSAQLLLSATAEGVETEDLQRQHLLPVPPLRAQEAAVEMDEAASDEVLSRQLDLESTPGGQWLLHHPILGGPLRGEVAQGSPQAELLPCEVASHEVVPPSPALSASPAARPCTPQASPRSSQALPQELETRNQVQLLDAIASEGAARGAADQELLLLVKELVEAQRTAKHIPSAAPAFPAAFAAASERPASEAGSGLAQGIGAADIAEALAAAERAATAAERAAAAAMTAAEQVQEKAKTALASPTSPSASPAPAAAPASTPAAAPTSAPAAAPASAPASAPAAAPAVAPSAAPAESPAPSATFHEAASQTLQEEERAMTGLKGLSQAIEAPPFVPPGAASVPPVLPGHALRALMGQEVCLDEADGSISGASLWLSMRPPKAARSFLQTFDICVPWAEARRETFAPSLKQLESPRQSPSNRSRSASSSSATAGAGGVLVGSPRSNASAGGLPSSPEVTSRTARTAGEELTPEQVLKRISGIMTEMTAMEASLGNLREELEKAEDLEPELSLGDRRSTRGLAVAPKVQEQEATRRSRLRSRLPEALSWLEDVAAAGRAHASARVGASGGSQPRRLSSVARPEHASRWRSLSASTASRMTSSAGKIRTSGSVRPSWSRSRDLGGGRSLLAAAR